MLLKAVKSSKRTRLVILSLSKTTFQGEKVIEHKVISESFDSFPAIEL